MASSSGPLNEELLCSICLDVSTDPVTAPCGHNFCRTCLNKFWTNTQTCFCPFCKETLKQQKKTLTSIDCFLISSRTVHISNWMIISLGFLLVAILLTFPKPYSASDPRTFTDFSQKVEDLRQEFSQLKKSTSLYVSQMYSLNEKLHKAGLKWAQLFAVDVTLDPETANPSLILSDDGKQVSHGNIKQDVPENPKRFSMISVLAKQGFSSGRFYFEVQVKGKTAWSLGVSREYIKTKGNLLTPVNGFWAVTLRNETEYTAGETPSVSLSLKVKPEVVGVFVDYEEGLVSFYDAGHQSHIYSFTGQTFTDKLYPYFSPYLNKGGKNSKPLIISPVS
ncbi:bloodthirsty-related gene family, member 31 isoform X2 [Puntigrus tetrazona]|uniref:bloodthirsty-related gene family, member 31 isoform X2 n=1 Tax=Puntigrus tetrazona TaxID=1606681 RepID=UPI001C8A5C97|nr:bloodthirsty-related gene family, member 31 isoform X2 [Puntigrus tetrazona]